MPLRVVVVAGVAGAGKTTVGRLLAKELGWAFEDADQHHPAANVAKMVAGRPLEEADRDPWLTSLRRLIEDAMAADRPLVLACSALKPAHRRRLAEGDPGVGFAMLTAEEDLLEQRLGAREGHFMPPSLLASQIEAQVWSSDAVPFDAAEPPEELVQRIAWWATSDLVEPLEPLAVGSPALRLAGPADAEAVAELHLRSWRRSYPGLAPRSAYQRLDLQARLGTWRALLEGDEPGRMTLLAEEGERLLGFCHATLGAAEADPVFGRHARIKYLYLDPACIGRGLGRELLLAAASALRSRGARSLALGVVVGNGPAIAFYRRMGAELAGSFTDPGPVWVSRNLLCLWPDIDLLVDSGGRDGSAGRAPGADGGA